MRKSDLQRELKEQVRSRRRRLFFPALVIAVSFFITVYCFVTFGADNNPLSSVVDKINISNKFTTSQPKNSQTGNGEGSSLCSDIVTKCEMESVGEKTPCDRSELELELKNSLSEPLKNESCKEIINSLEDMCPDNCVIDLMGLTLIPGAVDIEFEDFENKCQATATRSVMLKAPCREMK